MSFEPVDDERLQNVSPSGLNNNQPIGYGLKNPPVVPDTAATRYICTASAPATAERSKPFNGRTAHPDAWEVDSSCDCCARYKCPNCGHTWKEELPE